MSQEYRRWLEAADAGAMAQRLRIGKPLRFFKALIELNAGLRGRKDLDNYAKSTLDWGERVGLYNDDRDCNELVLRWAELEEVDCRLTVASCEEG